MSAPVALGRFVGTTLALLLPGASGCQEGPVAVLMPLPGCGLENEDLSALRVRPRGDFPTTESVLVVEGVEEVSPLPAGIQALTVEGLIGESVEAVGRTARLVAEGELPVYFSPPDQLCAVDSQAGTRDVGAIAVGALGDVLIVGGRGPDGLLLDEIIHVLDVDPVATTVAAHLPLPATGQTMHAVSDRTFAVIGGAGQNPTASRDVVVFEATDEPERTQRIQRIDVVRIEIPGQPEPGRAHHGGVRLLDDSVLVTGGCTESADGECVTASALSTAFFMRRKRDGTFVFGPAPSMNRPRFGHDLLVARDGVVFAVGGRNRTGAPVRGIERYIPGMGVWSNFGISTLSWASADAFVEGAAVLEGGILVIVLSDGTAGWVTETGTGPLANWCDPRAEAWRCFDGFEADGTVPPQQPQTRRLLALPGERVLADAFILPVALLARTAADVTDLAEPKPGQATRPPEQRTAAKSVLLADGTVLFAGGRDPIDGTLEQPLLLRFRPRLDGPDEQIPDITELAPASWVLHDAESIDANGAELRLTPVGAVQEFPAVWAHVRGFRSERFRFDVTLRATAGARVSLVLSRGAVAQTLIHFDPEEVRWVGRDTRGEAISVACEGEGLVFDAGRTLRFDVSPEGISVRTGNDLVAKCPGTDEGLVAVGLGASGGELVASGFRLSRR